MPLLSPTLLKTYCDNHNIIHNTERTTPHINNHAPPIINNSSRRTALISTIALTAACTLPPPFPSHASKLPQAADRAWEVIFGGGPADITFPESFLGTWNVQSILTSIQLPLGPEMVPDISQVKRAETQDKNRVITYQISFIRNSRDQVVFDRRFNTASLLHTYLPSSSMSDIERQITWNINDPNILDLSLPDNGIHITTRVTRRSEEMNMNDMRMECSEFFQEILEYTKNNNNSGGGGVQSVPKVKASQAFTKYHWRSAEQAGVGEPEVVATQVVSEYVPMSMSMMDGGGGNSLNSMIVASSAGKPVTVYTYKMAFTRVVDSTT